eukprot:2977610-Rhodomonas_salina.2
MNNLQIGDKRVRNCTNFETSASLPRLFHASTQSHSAADHAGELRSGPQATAVCHASPPRIRLAASTPAVTNFVLGVLYYLRIRSTTEHTRSFWYKFLYWVFLTIVVPTICIIQIRGTTEHNVQVPPGCNQPENKSTRGPHALSFKFH